MSHPSDKDPVKRDREADAEKVARRLDDAAQAVADLYAEETDARTGCCAIVFDCRTEVGVSLAATQKLVDVVQALDGTIPELDGADVALPVIEALEKAVRHANVEFVVTWLDNDEVVDYLAVLETTFHVPAACADFLLADPEEQLAVPMLIVGDKLHWSTARLRPMSSGGKA